MGAFQSGFSQGGQFANDAMRMQLEQERLDMAKAAHEQAMAEGKLRLTGLQRTEDATANLDNITRLGVQNPAAVEANRDAQMQSFRSFERAQQNGDDAAQYTAPTGLQQTYRPATDLELNNAMMGLASAKGDAAALSTLQGARKTMKFEDAFKNAGDIYDKMTDEERAAEMHRHSYNQNIPGFGNYVVGKKGGYINYLPPKGDPIQLSKEETRKFFQISAAAEHDPMRAMEMAEKSGDRIRGIAAQVFDTSTKGATVSNTATHYANSDANDAARTAAIKAHYTRPQAGDLREFQDGKGNSVMVDITALPRGKDGTIAMPTGLRPKSARPEMSMADVTARAKAYVESGMTDPDSPKTPLTMQKAVQIVQAEANGGYKSAADRIIEELAAQEGARANGGATSPGGIAPPTYNAQLKTAYDKWQNAKAPWYMPTPANNFEERNAEAEYDRLLRSPR